MNGQSQRNLLEANLEVLAIKWTVTWPYTHKCTPLFSSFLEARNGDLAHMFFIDSPSLLL